MTRQSVDIGGAVLEAALAGTGPLTVVFENGLGTSMEEWSAIVPVIAARTRALCYDRRRAPPAGRLTPRLAPDMAADLQRLLDVLSVRPPYVLVGHSWGGVVARAFAHAHPAAVAGLVFVDATHEAIDSKAFALLPLMYFVMGMAARTNGGRRWILRQLCPAAAPPEYRARIEQVVSDRRRWAQALRTARMEGSGIRASLEHVRRDYPDLPPIPIQVLTAGGTNGPNVKAIRRVHEAWQNTVRRAPASQYTNIPTSGHQLPLESPQSVIDAIVRVVDAVQLAPAT